MVKINKAEKLRIMETINDVLDDVGERCKKQVLDGGMTNAAYHSVQEFLATIQTDSGKCEG